MMKVLVVDDMPIFREPIAACLRAAGYQSLTAGNGQEALSILKTTPPDLILLDMAMPVMDGITFLAAMRRDPATREIPVILLTAMSDKDRVLQAAKLGVRDYMLKSTFSLRELLDRVKKHLGQPAPGVPISSADPVSAPRAAPATVVGHGGSPASEAAEAAIATPLPAASSRPSASPKKPSPQHEAPGTLTREQCLARIAGANQAKCLTGVVTQIVAMANSPRGDLADLARMIACDPVLASRVLKISNSAAYASSHGVVSTIDDAVRRVGSATIRDIAIAVGVFDAAPETGAEGFDRARFLQHSLGVAALCESLAENTSPAEKATAYLAGICHDLGEVLFYGAFAKEHQLVRDRAAESGESRPELEKRLLGATKDELERLLLQNVGLPDSVSGPILGFHDAESRCADNAPSGVHLLRMADAYVNGMLLTSRTSSHVVGLSRGDARAATGNENPPKPDSVSFRSKILSLVSLLGQHVSRGIEASMSPPFARQDKRILLIRAPGLSSFDPIEAALVSLARVTVANKLPHGIADYGGVVVVSPNSAQKGFTELDIDDAVKGAAPTLWIVGRRHAGASPGTTIRAAQWPLKLQDIADFIAALPEQPAAGLAKPPDAAWAA